MPHLCWSRRINEQEWSLHSPLREKGAADPHAVEQLAAWVDMLGSTQVTVRSDGEPGQDLLTERPVCQMQIQPESKAIAWINGHATPLLNLDTVGSDGTVRTVARSRTMRIRRTSVVSSGSVDRSNEGRRQDEIWHIRPFPGEVQRVHFDCEW